MEMSVRFRTGIALVFLEGLSGAEGFLGRLFYSLNVDRIEVFTSGSGWLFAGF